MKLFHYYYIESADLYAPPHTITTHGTRAINPKHQHTNISIQTILVQDWNKCLS